MLEYVFGRLVQSVDSPQSTSGFSGTDALNTAFQASSSGKATLSSMAALVQKWTSKIKFLLLLIVSSGEKADIHDGPIASSDWTARSRITLFPEQWTSCQ